MSGRIPGISFASLDEIQTNPYQPRREFNEEAIDELAQSIRVSGIIQPLVVRRVANGYELIAGERRLRASKKAGLKQVPIVIRKTTDREALELALVENIQRQDLNCVDEALAYFQLVQDFSLTQEEVAQRVGKDRASVANHLRLLRLPEAILEDLKKGALTLGHGKALLGLEENELRMKARSEVLEKHLSVRETEALVEAMKQGASATVPTGGQHSAPTPVQNRLQSLAQELARFWSTKVELKGSERRGKIVLHYSSPQDLERILEAMQNR
ncbi:MAG: ParB/RepB/Spo0J family partition protein [Bdellovibrionota bacterium]